MVATHSYSLCTEDNSCSQMQDLNSSAPDSVADDGRLHPAELLLNAEKMLHVTGQDLGGRLKK